MARMTIALFMPDGLAHAVSNRNRSVCLDYQRPSAMQPDRVKLQPEPESRIPSFPSLKDYPCFHLQVGFIL
jgi:hypothetical protein